MVYCLFWGEHVTKNTPKRHNLRVKRHHVSLSREDLPNCFGVLTDPGPCPTRSSGCCSFLDVLIKSGGKKGMGWDGTGGRRSPCHLDAEKKSGMKGASESDFSSFVTFSFFLFLFFLFSFLFFSWN